MGSTVADQLAEDGVVPESQVPEEVEALGCIGQIGAPGLVWYNTISFNMVWYGMVWYGIIRYSLVWYMSILYTYYIILQYSLVWYGILQYDRASVGGPLRPTWTSQRAQNNGPNTAYLYFGLLGHSFGLFWRSRYWGLWG